MSQKRKIIDFNRLKVLKWCPVTVLSNHSPDHNAPHHCKDALSDLLEKVYQDRGWDFRNYKKTSLGRRISKRLGANNISSYKDYYKILNSFPAEYDKLFSTITVKVSEFFREPYVFKLLKQALLSEYSDRKALRAWCCGCAYGEEAYSLGMLLNECLRPEGLQNTKIFATDIDNESLDIARKAIYREASMQNIGNATRERYFIKTGGGYQVKHNIRDMIRFGRIDIVRDTPLSKIDILFCRNLFIYFESSLQKKVFEKLNYALKAGGILVLGKAETLPAPFAHQYIEMADKSRIYKKEGSL